MTHVAIIGGGFAGLAAGVQLASEGVRVTLLEARARLGGRAYSFVDAATGATLDNGQHALMGCYEATLRFLERIGAGAKLVRQRNLHVEFRHRAAGGGAIVCAPLPAPLHLLTGIARYRLLRRRERLGVALGGARAMLLHRRNDARVTGWSVDNLLDFLGQSRQARVRFWYPLAVATLNEAPHRAAAAPFLEVLARAFFRSRADSQFVLPAVGLSDLYTDAARRWIEARGGRVHTHAAVSVLDDAGSRIGALTLRDGTRIEADAYVSTVPPRTLTAVLPASLRRRAPFDACAEFDSSPIVSAHLWFDQPLFDADFIGCLGTTTQWLFNRGKLAKAAGDGQRDAAGRISAVISAGAEIAETAPADIEARVVNDIRLLVPAARDARVQRCVVMKEKQATISATVRMERRRPCTETPLTNFFLAGDWIQTGLPPTIESAVISGERAAACIAARLRAQ